MALRSKSALGPICHRISSLKPPQVLSGALQGFRSKGIASRTVCSVMMQQQQQGSSIAQQPSSAQHERLLELLRSVVPELTHDSYKGQSGKVGVMGGCREYTGAPFFASMSAMRMGADLAYVFCTPSAAPVIKSYSPELIVMPVLPEQNEIDLLCSEEQSVALRKRQDAYFAKALGFIDRLSVLIIGPGLGDDSALKGTIIRTLGHIRERNLAVVIDGSGLNFIAAEPGLVKGYSNCILTPNIAEFGRLAEGVGLELEGKIGTHWQKHAQQLAAALDGPVLLSKGQVDIITDGRQQLVVTADGSPRRCGGQGDVLTGTIAAFISWQKAAKHKQQQAQDDTASTAVPPLMLAAYGGCLTMRAAAVLTYRHKGRSMVAGDMVDALGDSLLQQCGLLPQQSETKTDSGVQPLTKL